MQLSLRKRFGWTQVRGGRIVRVVEEHQVPTWARSVFADEHGGDLLGRQRMRRFPYDEKSAQAEPGDLAVEILSVKTDALLGHTYLSGPAIQLNRYTPAESDWFEEASRTLLEIPVPRTSQFASPQSYVVHLTSLLMDIKYGAFDVGAFEYHADNDDEAEVAARQIAAMWKSARTDDAVAKTHLLGIVRGKKNHVNMHFQPPHHFSDFAATPFQVGLVLSSLRKSVDGERSN